MPPRPSLTGRPSSSKSHRPSGTLAVPARVELVDGVEVDVHHVARHGVGRDLERCAAAPPVHEAHASLELVLGGRVALAQRVGAVPIGRVRTSAEDTRAPAAPPHATQPDRGPLGAEQLGAEVTGAGGHPRRVEPRLRLVGERPQPCERLGRVPRQPQLAKERPI